MDTLEPKGGKEGRREGGMTHPEAARNGCFSFLGVGVSRDIFTQVEDTTVCPDAIHVSQCEGEERGRCLLGLK